jgi:hypothetical protein
MLADKHFRRMLTLERQRSERSQKPFLLMLFDMGDSIPSEKNRKLLENILAALSDSIRDTDVTGWYKNDSVLGVICTEFGFDEYLIDSNATRAASVRRLRAMRRDTILSTMMTRLSETLRRNLSEQLFSQTCISFHLFPEEWNLDIPQRPTDPDAPVYAPRKPKPHLRSGSATAVPEPDDAEQGSPDNSFIRVARLSIEDSAASGQ